MNNWPPRQLARAPLPPVESRGPPGRGLEEWLSVRSVVTRRTLNSSACPRTSSWLAVSAERGLRQFLPPKTQNSVLSGPPLTFKREISLRSSYPCSFFQTLYVMHSELLLKGPSLIALRERVTPFKGQTDKEPPLGAQCHRLHF